MFITTSPSGRRAQVTDSPSSAIQSRLSDDWAGWVTLPRTSPLATLVGSYGATHSRSMRSCDPCFARPLHLLVSKKINPRRAYVSYVLLSKKINPHACGLFFLLCSIEIGEVLPCNGGVRIIRKQTINPLGLQPLPLYFLYRKHRGRKGFHATRASHACCMSFCLKKNKIPAELMSLLSFCLKKINPQACGLFFLLCS